MDERVVLSWMNEWCWHAGTAGVTVRPKERTKEVIWETINQSVREWVTKGSSRDASTSKNCKIVIWKKLSYKKTYFNVWRQRKRDLTPSTTGKKSYALQTHIIASWTCCVWWWCNARQKPIKPKSGPRNPLELEWRAPVYKKNSDNWKWNSIGHQLVKFCHHLTKIVF